MNLDPRDPEAGVARERMFRLITAYRSGHNDVFFDELGAVLTEVAASENALLCFAHLLRTFTVASGATTVMVADMIGADYLDVIARIDLALDREIEDAD